MAEKDDDDDLYESGEHGDRGEAFEEIHELAANAPLLLVFLHLVYQPQAPAFGRGGSWQWAAKAYPAKRLTKPGAANNLDGRRQISQHIIAKMTSCSGQQPGHLNTGVNGFQTR